MFVWLLPDSIYHLGSERRRRGGTSLGETGSNSLLDSALVGTSEDLEVSVHAPLGVPGVGNSPVRGSGGGNSPSDDLDGVSSKLGSSLVDVDSRSVLVEVGVD